jgi:hypothetical protein
LRSCRSYRSSENARTSIRGMRASPRSSPGLLSTTWPREESRLPRGRARSRSAAFERPPPAPRRRRRLAGGFPMQRGHPTDLSCVHGLRSAVLAAAFCDQHRHEASRRGSTLSASPQTPKVATAANWRGMLRRVTTSKIQSSEAAAAQSPAPGSAARPGGRREIRPILVTGMHRSGTTWLGNMLWRAEA